MTASQIVVDAQSAATRVNTYYAELEALITNYDTLEAYQQAKDGKVFIHAHFIDINGDPRTDLNVTEEQITDLIGSLKAVRDIVAEHLPTIVTTAN